MYLLRCISIIIISDEFNGNGDVGLKLEIYNIYRVIKMLCYENGMKLVNFSILFLIFT